MSPLPYLDWRPQGNDGGSTHHVPINVHHQAVLDGRVATPVPVPRGAGLAGVQGVVDLLVRAKNDVQGIKVVQLGGKEKEKIT